MSDEPARRTWTSQSLTLSYADWGNERAPLLILLHGSGDHARSWDQTARALRADWHVIAPDLRGHGDSQWSREGAYMTPYHVQDLVDLIDALKGERVTFVAHSFGGNLAMRYAAIYPERVEKLAVVDGLGPAPAFIARWEQEGPLPRTRNWIARRRELEGQPQKLLPLLEDAAKRLMRDRPRLTLDLALQLAEHGARREGDGYVFKRDPRAAVYGPEDFIQEGPAVRSAVTAPVLLFWGPESWTTHPDEDGRAAPIRDHRTIVYQEAGHWLHHDQFDAFIADLRAFL